MLISIYAEYVTLEKIECVFRSALNYSESICKLRINRNIQNQSANSESIGTIRINRNNQNQSEQSESIGKLRINRTKTFLSESIGTIRINRTKNIFHANSHCTFLIFSSLYSKITVHVRMIPMIFDMYFILYICNRKPRV